MQKKTINVLQHIYWILFIEDLTIQEREEFTALKSALKSVINSLEFSTGKMSVDLELPESYVTEKTLDFLNESDLKIGDSDGDFCIWFEEDDDDSSDYDYDEDDWSYDYWDFRDYGRDCDDDDYLD